MMGSGFRALPRTVWLLGFASLFTDLSSSLIYSLLPLFLVSHLGASVLAVGVIDGIAEATASFGKVLSGALSDWFARRKLLTVFGYGVSAAAKLLFPIAMTAGAVLLARFFDRLGKGIRGAPRDALVADVTPVEMRGTAYGLRQSLDDAGTLLGPLAATALMLLFVNDVRLVFWIACFPAIVSLAILVFGVREPVVHGRIARLAWPLRRRELRQLGGRFWLFTAVLFIAFVTRFTDAFYLLRGQGLGLAVAQVPLLLATTSMISTFLTAPVGRWSDRIGRRLPVAAGLVALVLSHAVLGLAESPALVFVGAGLFGLHFALTQPALAALVADVTPPDRRGTAFGVLYLMAGFADLTGSVGGGWLWDAAGPDIMFAAAAGVSLLGLLAFLALSAIRIREPGAG
jgi:MFS family permease